jgi:hypothetical protein
MAEIVSLEAAKVAANSKMTNDEALGRLKIITITSPATAAWAQNDTIASPVDLPVGSRIVDCWVHHEAMGTSVTMDIGLRAAESVDAAQTVIDVDGIADGIDVASAGQSHAVNGEYVNVTATTPIKRTTQVSNVYASLLSANPTDDQQFRIDVVVALPG